MQCTVGENPPKVASYGDNQSLFRPDFVLVRFVVSDFYRGEGRVFAQGPVYYISQNCTPTFL